MESDQEILFLWSQLFGSSDDVLEVLERDHAVFYDVNFLELVTQEIVSLVNLVPVDKFKGFRVRLLDLLGGGFLDVSCVKSSNGIDTNWDELRPVNSFVLILVSQCNQHVDIVIIKTIGQSSERVSELVISQQTSSILVHGLEHLFK